jgi:hypothetical protein
MRQAEKAPRFLGDLGEVDETEGQSDHVEQIAMFSGG